MASSSRVLCLNLGMQTISIADFQKNPNGGITIAAFHSTELLEDPGADATRNDQIRMAVEELREKLKIKRKEKINYALPSQSVFTRFVKLPEASADQVDQIIGFEAQQNVPFPIDEVVWDYQVLGKAQENKMDVVLVAIKADQLNNINQGVESPGFKAGTIDVAPMALYNAFQFNYSDLTGCSLMIDIGARTTNLIFVENQRVFSRTIPIGGNVISAAIAKEFGCDLTTAEQLKKAKGFVGLGGAYADPEDPTVAKISKMIRNTLTRLHAEIARSISFYRSNHGGSQPVRAFLAGGTVSFPYMREFFNEKLQMPIEFFNPLQNVIVSSDADADILSKSAHMIGELIGVACRELGGCPIALNLRPSSVVQAQALAIRKPYLITAAACFFCVLALWSFYFYRSTEIRQEQTKAIQNEASNLERFAKQLDSISAEQGKLQSAAAPLLLAVNERAVWVSIIDELAEKLPPRFIWITKLTPLSNGATIEAIEPPSSRALSPGFQPPHPRGQQAAANNQIDAIEIQGLYLDNPNRALVIDDFVNNLKKSDKFAIDEKGREKTVVVHSSQDNLTWAYKYTIRLPLKHPIAL
ncbi:MAG: Amuc_1101 family PilM-like pilus complex protein [Chthoniobacterales bacterium]